MTEDMLEEGTSRVLAPDFVPRKIGPMLSHAEVDGDFVQVTWRDGLAGRFHSCYLRENDVGSAIDPETREKTLDIADLPLEARIVAAEVSGTRLSLRFDDGAVTYHNGDWLRDIKAGHHLPHSDVPSRYAWDASDMPEPVSFDGPTVLSSDEALFDFLTATHRYGLARLRGLGSADGTVRKVAEKIGIVRSSSFGFLFDVENKPNPDSAAYTGQALSAHTDLPTRELQPGLQLLHCRDNSCPDGYSTMVDGFRIADEVRETDHAAFDALTSLNWIFTNRHPDFDYRFSAPVVALEKNCEVSEIRIANALRAEPDMPEARISEAYRSLRLFMTLALDPRFVCRYPFEPGDLVIFDNRRVLHGRDGFNPNDGYRRLQGCYVDRDDLFSRLRVLARNARACASTGNAAAAE
ncbi:MAG: TauD/TfdA family dioxygenase [Pseudomonadota bacterium]